MFGGRREREFLATVMLARARPPEPGWTSQVARRFTLRELLSSVPPDEIETALTWLYQSIERGEVIPEPRAGRALRYRCDGARPRKHAVAVPRDLAG
jgi:hypothetical protein